MTCWKVVKSVLILCLILIPIFIWMTVWNGPVHYLPHYLPCPEIFSMKLQYAEEKPVQLFPQLFYPQPRLLDQKYTTFVGRFVASAEKLFMKGYRVKYYIFTNDPQVIPRVQLQPGRSLSIVPIKKYSHWQEISMRRMEAINRHIAEVSHQEVNYLFCLDIDMVFHNPWGAETLGEMVAAIHPGYYNVPRSQFPYERRSSSAAFIPDSQGDFYYAGAVFGGLVKQVYEFTRACHMTILTDKANGIMATWQEESHLNRHFFSHKPSKLLSPEYVWDDTKPKPPEVRLIRFSTVDKDYKEIRD
ncbi:globoside alpha-1,3-N-acetylgalactosaminyltransferase 1 isoform X2 [Lepidochelys kempii]|uniref:globoside alpha-1,3-N-acetylgalactosaminyltransferase 1 isoform X2 n=1 Tax=Lepidochelys kempii TaxID=8472 RepID=UPI003C6EED06